MNKKQNSHWTPDEPARLLIEKRLIDTIVLDGKSKTEALKAIRKIMEVRQRQAYKILDYLLVQRYFALEPDRLRRGSP